MTKEQFRFLKADLIKDEGKRKFAYECTEGKITVGVGRNLEDKGLSEDEIDYLLLNDIRECSDITESSVPFFRGLNEVRQNVLINMSFNMGIRGVLGFKKMLHAAMLGDFEEAARQMLDSKWARQVGQRAVRLSEEMKTGKRNK